MKYKYFFLLNKREVVFYADSRVDAEDQYHETFGVHPMPAQFLRRENS